MPHNEPCSKTGSIFLSLCSLCRHVPTRGRKPPPSCGSRCQGNLRLPASPPSLFFLLESSLLSLCSLTTPHFSPASPLPLNGLGPDNDLPSNLVRLFSPQIKFLRPTSQHKMYTYTEIKRTSLLDFSDCKLLGQFKINSLKFGGVPVWLGPSVYPKSACWVTLHWWRPTLLGFNWGWLFPSETKQGWRQEY